MPGENLLLNGHGNGFIRNIGKNIKNNQKFTKEIGFRTKVFDKLEIKVGPQKRKV